MSAKKTIVLGFGLFLVAGCSSSPSGRAVHLGDVQPDNAYVLSRLTKSADTISRQVRRLERESLRNIHLQTLPAPTGGAAQLMTVNYDGPFEDVVRSIGKMIRYRVVFDGKPPAVPVIVSVHARKRTAQSILESVGLQVGSDIGIDVDEIGNRLTVTYKDVPPISGNRP